MLLNDPFREARKLLLLLEESENKHPALRHHLLFVRGFHGVSKRNHNKGTPPFCIPPGIRKKNEKKHPNHKVLVEGLGYKRRGMLENSLTERIF